MTGQENLKASNRSTVHALSPQQGSTDRGRQNFIFHVKRQLGGMASTGLQQVARNRSGSDSPTREQSSEALLDSPAFAAWTALSKGAQRQMWRSLDDMIERQHEALDASAEAIAAKPSIGSLELAADFQIPEYLQQHAFHGQPGGYINSRDASDLRAGALQEAGGTLYSRGIGSGKKDSKAAAVVRFVNERFPQLDPKRVLDLGCGYGGQTCGYAQAFPEAETCGVDVGEALLRYAHLRAESLRVPLHLRQEDAARTSYPDGHFDLIVSNILLHEVPTAKMQDIMRECYRLAAPGGVVIHQDVPTQKADMPGYRKFLAMWQTDHNDEPFWENFADSSVPDALVSAGSDRQAVFEEYVGQIDGPLTWYFVGAQKP